MLIVNQEVSLDTVTCLHEIAGFEFYGSTMKDAVKLSIRRNLIATTSAN